MCVSNRSSLTWTRLSWNERSERKERNVVGISTENNITARNLRLTSEEKKREKRIFLLSRLVVVGAAIEEIPLLPGVGIVKWQVDGEISRWKAINTSARRNECLLSWEEIVMGCGSSVPIASSLGQKKSVPPTSGRLPPIKRDEKSLPKSTTRPSNLEPLTLVCFDDHFLSYRKELQSIIDDFHSFAQLDQCEEFLTDPSQQSACIFLLISSKSFVDLLSRVQHLPQVDSIYLLDEHQRIRVDPQWKRRYPKVRLRLASSREREKSSS